MKAKLVLHHDDFPCTERLIDHYCPVCAFHPDMQSTCFYSYCPTCDKPLKNMVCPTCHQKCEPYN